MNNNNSLSLVDKKIDRKIEEWRQRLIDLSRRNRLLYYKKTKSANLTLLIPEFDTVFNRLVLQEKPWKFWLPPLEDEQPEDENSERKQIKSDLKELLKIHPPRQDDLVCNNFNRKELEKILKNLYRKAIIDYRERGIRILYITFGMMKWKETTNDLIYSPLILCPVELKRDTARDPFILSLTEEEIVLNPALQVKLLKDFNLKCRILNNFLFC